MTRPQDLFTQGKIDFFMNWLDSYYKKDFNKVSLAHHLNICLDEVDTLLQYYQLWLQEEQIRDKGRAYVVYLFIETHEFLSPAEQAELLNITTDDLNYYLSLKV